MFSEIVNIMLLLIFHASVIGINWFSVWYAHMYLSFPAHDDVWSLIVRRQYLTVWCTVLQIIYFSVSFLNDVVGTNATAPKNPPLIRKVKDILFSLAFPLAIYVSITFWTLYFVHKDLIMPREIEINVPVWMNHVLHTLIVPFIVIELFVTRRNYPSRKLGICIMIIFNTVYSLWLFGVYLSTGVWIYPFMNVFNWPMRFAFCVGSIVGGIGIYIVGEKINHAVSPRLKVSKNGVTSNKIQ